MPDINENEDAVVEETEEVAEETQEDTDDPTELKARIKKLEEKAIAQRERSKILKQAIAKKEKAEAKSSSELDNGDYALLTAKGIEDEEDIDFIQSYMKKWDKPLRDVLRDADIQAKLKGFKLEREVKNAMPSATKRTNNGKIDNIDYWIAKYEQTGELPDNFELQSEVINTLSKRNDPSNPPWRSK